MSTVNRSQSQVETAQHMRDDAFWRAHGGIGLVWSNSNASGDIMIANALLRPGFRLLLDIAARFGLRRLTSRWEILKKEMSESIQPEEHDQLRRVTPTVERGLAHMEEAVRQK